MSPAAPFQDDRPLRRGATDLLGFERLAEGLAEQLGSTIAGGLLIGIRARVEGGGRTSFLNLLHAALLERRVIVLRLEGDEDVSAHLQRCRSPAGLPPPLLLVDDADPRALAQGSGDGPGLPGVVAAWRWTDDAPEIELGRTLAPVELALPAWSAEAGRRLAERLARDDEELEAWARLAGPARSAREAVRRTLAARAAAACSGAPVADVLDAACIALAIDVPRAVSAELVDHARRFLGAVSPSRRPAERKGAAPQAPGDATVRRAPAREATIRRANRAAAGHPAAENAARETTARAAGAPTARPGGEGTRSSARSPTDPTGAAESPRGGPSASDVGRPAPSDPDVELDAAPPQLDELAAEQAARRIFELGDESDPMLEADLATPVSEEEATAPDAWDELAAADALPIAAGGDAVVNERAGDVERRRRRCLLLGRHGGPAARDELLSALADPHPAVRLSASQVLGSLGDPTAAPELRRLLGAPDASLRRSAAFVLGRLADSASRDELVRLLVDVSPSVRRAAAAALGRLGSETVVRPLLLALEDAHAGVRMAAETALSRTLGGLTESALDEQLTDPDPRCRRAALRIAGRLGFGSRAAIERLLGEPGRVAVDAAEALGRRREEASLPALAAAASGARGDLRSAALAAIGRVAEAPPAEGLARMLADPDATARDAAKAALARCPGAVEAVLALLAEGTEDVQRSAADALGRTGDRRAVGPLLELHDTADPELRRAAAASLVRLGFEV